MKGIAERVEGTSPMVSARTGEDYLARAVRPLLLSAIDDGRLAIPIHELSKHVRVTKTKDARFELVGGRKNFARQPDLNDLRMRGGGSITFAATLRVVADGLEVEAYNFERTFSPDHRPAFVRFDLNPRGHANDTRDIRSHLHPGNDNIQLPAPIFAPHELLELLLGDFGADRDRAARAKGL